jgi:hypothetical protein
MLNFLFFFSLIYFFSLLKINTQQEDHWENEREEIVFEGGKLRRDFWEILNFFRGEKNYLISYLAAYVKQMCELNINFIKTQ